MNYRGPLGVPRITDTLPLVKQNRDSGRIDENQIRQLLDPISTGLDITVGDSGDFASADFRMLLEPARERKSSVIVLRDNEVFETTLRFPIIDVNAMPGSEVRDNMEKVLTRSGAPDESKIEIPVRMYDMDTRNEAHNPHIVVKKPDDMDIKEYSSWAGRAARAFDDFFPKFIRAAEGG